MSRRGESIYRRKDGRWEACYIHHYENGIAKYRSVYARSYAEVKAKRLMEQAQPERVMTSLYVHPTLEQKRRQTEMLQPKSYS